MKNSKNNEVLQSAKNLEEVERQYIGERGTKEREDYQEQVQLDKIGTLIKHSRKMKKWTQTELGDRIGVKKAQISRIERDTSNVTMKTLLKVLRAMDAEMTLQIKIEDETYVVTHTPVPHNTLG